MSVFITKCWWNVTHELSISEMMVNDCGLTGNNGLPVATFSPLWQLTAGLSGKEQPVQAVASFSMIGYELGSGCFQNLLID